MAYTYPKLKSNSDGSFGPTINGNKYLPASYHNSTSRERKIKGRIVKSRWKIKQYQQFEVFKISDENAWYCNKDKDLISILDNGDEIIGKNGEVLAYFYKPVNINDPWHGHPVLSGRVEIDESLLDLWESTKIISPKIRIKIGKQQL